MAKDGLPSTLSSLERKAFASKEGFVFILLFFISLTPPVHTDAWLLRQRACSCSYDYAGVLTPVQLLLLLPGAWLLRQRSCSYDYAGVLAPVKLLLLPAQAILLPIVIVFSTLPYIVALSVYPDSNLYVAGFFSDVAAKIAGQSCQALPPTAAHC